MLLKQKIVGRSRLYDILHKGWVNLCIAATVVSLGGLIYYGSFILKDSIQKRTVKSENKEGDLDLATAVIGNQGLTSRD